MNSIKEDLRQYAKEIGVDLLGVTSPEPFNRYLNELCVREPYYQKRYSHRIQTWKNFATPQSLMEDAKSIVVIGFYYLIPDINQNGLRGRIARIITHGHLGIIKRARLISQFLGKHGYKAIIGAHRKEAAIRAGLGSLGKNGLLINKKYGSWVAYQSIITNADMEYDEPFVGDICGKCNECISSCPTFALYEPYRLNPQHCITYLLTSQKISEKYWDKLQNYILGCDICQEVCPKNKDLKPKENIESIFPDLIGIYPLLERILELEENEFQKEVISYIFSKISDSSFNLYTRYRWLWKVFQTFSKKGVIKGKEAIPETFIHISGKLLLYKRNALIAIGNSGRSELRDNVARFTNHPFLQNYAKWTLQRID